MHEGLDTSQAEGYWLQRIDIRLSEVTIRYGVNTHAENTASDGASSVGRLAIESKKGSRLEGKRALAWSRSRCKCLRKPASWPGFSLCLFLFLRSSVYGCVWSMLCARAVDAVVIENQIVFSSRYVPAHRQQKKNWQDHAEPLSFRVEIHRQKQQSSCWNPRCGAYGRFTR